MHPISASCSRTTRSAIPESRHSSRKTVSVESVGERFPRDGRQIDGVHGQRVAAWRTSGWVFHNEQQALVSNARNTKKAPAYVFRCISALALFNIPWPRGQDEQRLS